MKKLIVFLCSGRKNSTLVFTLTEFAFILAANLNAKIKSETVEYRHGNVVF